MPAQNMTREQLAEKWKGVLDRPNYSPIKDKYRRDVTAILLENQETESVKEYGGGMLSETAPTNFSGAFPGTVSSNPNLQGFDPILIALARRAMPNLIAYDLCGVQPMSGPTGLIFALRSRYGAQDGDEALFQEANTAWSSAGLSANSHTGTSPANATYDAARTMSTLKGEALGTSGNTAIPEMAFSIEKVVAQVGTRALKAEYTHEIQQDLKAVHNLDAEGELANILSAEILAEINREIVRTIGYVSVAGSRTTTTPGTFDMDVDSNGRWSVEKFKGLFFQIEREANAIAKQTRRGKGNIILTSSDVASALVAAKLMDAGGNELSAGLTVDDTGSTFVGTLNGRYKVYVDPYAPVAASSEYFIVGYKGASPFDAGMFYCPYVPLQMMRAVNPTSFIPVIGFKTRYAVVANPFSQASGISDGTLSAANNVYYRKTVVTNLF